MTMQWLVQNWALAAASVLGLAILLFVLFRLYAASPSGSIGAQAAILRNHKTVLMQAEARLEKATDRVSRLRSKADEVKPKLLSEAEEAIEDARALQKIAADQVLRTQKLLRDVILEEFPPNRQDGLRQKYL